MQLGGRGWLTPETCQAMASGLQTRLSATRDQPNTTELRAHVMHNATDCRLILNTHHTRHSLGESSSQGPFSVMTYYEPQRTEYVYQEKLSAT